jgi:hypothetical protein
MQMVKISGDHDVATGPRARIYSAMAVPMWQGECSIISPEARRIIVIRASNLVPASRTGYEQSHMIRNVFGEAHQ